MLPDNLRDEVAIFLPLAPSARFANRREATQLNHVSRFTFHVSRLHVL